MVKKNTAAAYPPEGGCRNPETVPATDEGKDGLWARLVPDLIDRLGQDGFLADLALAARQILPFENCIIFLFRGRARPLELYSSFDSPEEREALRLYAEKTYVLNPFYQAYLKGLAPGVYRMRDLAPDAYFGRDFYRAHSASRAEDEEIGYLTDNWPKGREEVQIAIALPEGAMVEISFNRPVSNGGFAEEDIALLTMIEPAVAALARQYWQFYRLRQVPPCARHQDR